MTQALLDFCYVKGYNTKQGGTHMEWVEAISRAVEYMEEHLTDELTVEEISDQVNISPFYFQKGFSLLCGFSIKEYIRSRRLALAGNELATGDMSLQQDIA